MARLTKREREAGWREAERQAWEEFATRAAALRGRIDAEVMVSQAPPPDSPGRRFYSNLGFFLGAFSIPGRATTAEKSLYLQLIERMDAAGELIPGAGKLIGDRLRHAIRERPFGP